MVVEATVTEVTDRGALISLEEPISAGGREVSRVLAVPTEPGWGLDALWFAYIRVDAFPADGDGGGRLGSWWMRLGSRA